MKESLIQAAIEQSLRLQENWNGLVYLRNSSGTFEVEFSSLLNLAMQEALNFLSS